MWGRGAEWIYFLSQTPFPSQSPIRKIGWVSQVLSWGKGGERREGGDELIIIIIIEVLDPDCSLARDGTHGLSPHEWGLKVYFLSMCYKLWLCLYGESMSLYVGVTEELFYGTYTWREDEELDEEERLSPVLTHSSLITTQEKKIKWKLEKGKCVTRFNEKYRQGR